MHIVYLLTFDCAPPNKYIGTKSNAVLRDGRIYSDGKEYRTSSSDSELFKLLDSGCVFEFSMLGEFETYKEALEFERVEHIRNDVVASTEYFNRIIATTCNFTDPDFATYRHIETGKTVRLPRNHPMVKNRTYVGVTHGVTLDLSVERSEQLRETGRTAFLGKKHSEETKRIIGEKNSVHMQSYWDNMDEETYARIGKRISEAITGVPKSAEFTERLQGSIVLKNLENGQTKRFYAHERDEAMGSGWIPANKGIRLDKCGCMYCDIKTSATNIKRWHNEKCKHRKEAIILEYGYKKYTNSICVFCGATGDPGNIGKYHNNKCKHKMTITEFNSLPQNIRLLVENKATYLIEHGYVKEDYFDVCVNIYKSIKESNEDNQY